MMKQLIHTFFCFQCPLFWPPIELALELLATPARPVALAEVEKEEFQSFFSAPSTEQAPRA